MKHVSMLSKCFSHGENFGIASVQSGIWSHIFISVLWRLIHGCLLFREVTWNSTVRDEWSGCRGCDPGPPRTERCPGSSWERVSEAAGASVSRQPIVSKWMGMSNNWRLEHACSVPENKSKPYGWLEKNEAHRQRGDSVMKTIRQECS